MEKQSIDFKGFWNKITGKKRPGEIKVSRNHKKALTLGVKHNSQVGTKNQVFLIKYKKMNGDIVTRKIEPFSFRGNTVVAHDQHRDGVRSFKMERIDNMKKIAFIKGFESCLKNTI